MALKVFADVNPILAVLLASVTPGVEPRYAYILGLALGLHPMASLAVSATSTIILAIGLAAFVTIVDPILESGCRARRHPVNPACLYLRVRGWSGGRGRGAIEKWGTLGLVLLIAVPLPATGMYTGALAAALLGIRGVRLAAALALGGLASLAVVVATSGAVGVVAE